MCNQGINFDRCKICEASRELKEGILEVQKGLKDIYGGIRDVERCSCKGVDEVGIGIEEVEEGLECILQCLEDLGCEKTCDCGGRRECNGLYEILQGIKYIDCGIGDCCEGLENIEQCGRSQNGICGVKRGAKEIEEGVKEIKAGFKELFYIC